MDKGDYVRTNCGEICKITKLNDTYIGVDYTECHLYYDGDGTPYFLISNEEGKHIIIKSSPNILDLIEVGDYVNGIKIDEIIEKGDKEICYRYIYANEEFDVYTFKKEDIKSIVTKEQFESMEYKIGE